MFDDLDDGPRIAVWTVLGVVALLLFGLLGAIATKTLGAKSRVVPVASTAAGPAANAVVGADVLVEEPLAGDIAGTLYFELGSAALPADAGVTLDAIKAAAAAAAGRRIVISGFHDASGDPARNAELAKERAKSVRAALQAAGVDAARLALRKPESTTGSGDDRAARRVEVRILP